MPRAAFTTLGCKVNQYETQKILESFEDHGFEVVPFDAEAEVYVINSCSVTSIAEQKSRQMVRKLARQRPEADVVVTGCAAQMGINKDVEFEGASLVVPNPDKLETLHHLVNLRPQWNKLPPRSLEDKTRNRTRATLKVQDGCNVFCSYCSIPFTRPVMTGRPWHQVLAEARALADQGYHEAVLTGVLIGSYGPETGSEGPDFPELVRLLSEESGIHRLRISSIEMQQVSRRLVDLMAEGRIVPHFHIPLQSGDSGVLRDMNRPYDQDRYLELCSWLQSEIPDISISADIMVGFPTETEERFLSSLHVVKTVGYQSIHVFSFSPRFGTPADHLGDPIPAEEKARRREVLTQAAKETGAAHAARFVGRRMEVLVESKVTPDGLLEGLTPNYLRVQFAGPKSLARRLATVEIQEARNGILFGELADPSVAPSETRLLVR